MMAFLLLFPIVILFASAGAILLLRRLRPGFGYSWLLAVLSVLGVWGLILYFHFHTPPPVIFINWLPVTSTIGTVIFQLDTPAWVYTFCLAGLAAAVILTASARLQHRSNPSTWAATLAITAAGMLATLSGTPLTLILAWTLIDAIELVFILAIVQEKGLSTEAVGSFSFRVTGTLVLMGAMVLSKAGGQDLLLVAPRPELSIFLLIAAGLRLGVLPLHLPYMRELTSRRGAITVLRMAAAASSLVLIGRLPLTAVPPSWFPWLLLFGALAGFYGAVMWLISPDEIRGRPYWMIALAGMAVASVVRSYPEASLAWGTVMILSGGLLFLFSARARGLIFLPVLGILAFSGLPFTPGGAGWHGLIVLPINLPDLGFWLVQTLLLLGYVRHMLRPEEALSSMERWIKGVYPFGLLLLPATAWLAAFLGWPGTFTSLENLGASLAAALVAMAVWFGLRRLQPWWQIHPERTDWVIAAGRPVARFLNGLLRLDWLYRILTGLYQLSQRVINTLTLILEGEGGVLWVLVLLALLVSLFQSSTAGGR
jgi:hypothetical protein